MKTLCIILLICCCFSAKTQTLPPCIDSGLTVRYFNQGFQILLRNQNATANGGIIASGFRSDTVLFRKIGFITKLNAAKQSEWSLQIKPPSDTISIDIFDAKEFSDGNILAVGVFSNERTLSKQAIIYKFTNTGQLVWEKKIDSVGNIYNGYNVLLINSINEGLNKDIILSFSNSRDRYQDLMFTTIVKLDVNGNIIWQDNLSNTYFDPSEKYVNQIAIGNIFVINGFLYAICTQNNTVIAFKINYTTGQIIRGRYSNYTPITSSTFVASEIFHATNLVNNKYLALTTETEYFTPENEMFTFLFDTALNIVKQQRITVSGISYSIFSGVRKNIISTTSDTILVSMPVDTAVYFISIDNQGNAIQQRKIANANLSFGYYNKNLINGTSNALAVILSANPFNQPSGFELVQMQDFDLGITEYCVGTTEPHVNVQPYPLDTGNLSFRFINNQGYKVVPFSSTITNLNFPKQTVCKVVSTCDSIKILGVDTVCTINTPVYFKAYRNKDCIKRINWTLSNAANAQLVQVNDSIIKLTFTNEYNGYLYATINACRVFKDSIKITVFNPPSTINLGADTTFCTSTIVLLNAKKGFKNYRWQDGSTDSTFAATTTGQYYVTAYNYCNQQFTDTINLIINSASPVNLGNDTSVCSSPPFYLNAGVNYKTYLWNTGATTQKIKVNNNGDYYVIATDSNNCKVYDTITINSFYQSPKINIDKKNIFCLQQNNFIDAGGGYTNYLWQDGSNKQVIEVNKIGKYKVIVTDANKCKAADSVIIKLLVKPPSNFLFGDTTICKDAEIVLFANRVFKDYLWSNNATLSTTKITNATKYWLTATDYYGCKGTDTIQVFTKYCDGIFYMPTAFTPNADKLNDVLKPSINAPLVSFSLTIFNRFGQKIFSSNNIANGWNGLYNNQLQETGSYVWLCNYTIKNMPPQIKKGTVVLLR